MKKLLLPLAATAAVALAGPSWAWSHVSGKITSVDPKAHQMVLDNGTTYRLERGVKVSNLAAGDKVTISVSKGKDHLVNKVTKVG